MAREVPALEAFDLLSDELVVLILRKAVADPFSQHIGGLEEGSVWGVAAEAFKLKTVCKRFQRLAVPDAIPYAVWNFKEQGDPMTLVRCLQAVREAGSKLTGIELDFRPLVAPFEDRRNLPVPVVSLPFVDSLLCASGVTRLRTFHLSTNGFKCVSLQDRAHSDEASTHLLTLLAAQRGLHRLELNHSGFHFRSPLLHTFSELRELVIRTSVVSDSVIESLLERCLQLSDLILEQCEGMSSPVFKSQALRLLRLSTFGPEVLEAVTIASLDPRAKIHLPRVGVLKLGRGVSKLASLMLNGEPRSVSISYKTIPVDSLFLSGEWTLAGLQSMLRTMVASQQLTIVLCSMELREAGDATFSSLMESIPSGIGQIYFNGVLEHFALTEECKSRLESLRFIRLKSLALVLVSEPDSMFNCLEHLFACCPALEVASFDLEDVACPGGDLLTKVASLQAQFPRVKLKFLSEPIYLTRSYIEGLDEEGLAALQDQV